MIGEDGGQLGVMEVNKALQLARDADLIVLGKIRSVADRHLDLRVDEVLRMKDSIDAEAGGTLKLRKFFDWQCASRWKEYKPGQRLLMFLIRDEHRDGVLRPMGGADEGEMPLKDGIVYVNWNIRSYSQVVRP